MSKDVLIPIFEIKDKKINYKLFACDGLTYLDKDYGFPNDYSLDSNKFWFTKKVTVDDLVKKLGLDEVSLSDIVSKKVSLSKAGKYQCKTCFYLSDTSFYNAIATTNHYVLDYEDDETYLYGTEKDMSMDTYAKISESTLFPSKITFDTSYSGENIYGVVSISSFDDDATNGILLFSTKEDAEKYIDLYKEGELSEYIYLNCDYPCGVQNIITNIEELICIDFYDICENPSRYDNLIIMPQVICQGMDVYN